MRKEKIEKKDDISIVLCGAAGLGIQTVEQLLVKALKQTGYNVFGTKEYMSRVRGGLNSTEIRVSNKRVRSFVDRIDIFFIFSKGAIERHINRITENTVIFGEKDVIDCSDNDKDCITIEVPLTKKAKELGNKVYTNSIAAGVIAGLLEVDLKFIDDFFVERFSRKGEEIVEKNKQAVRIGAKIANDLEGSGKINFEVTIDPNVKKDILLDGHQAVGIGALAGGCNFVAAYPMSPSTGVFTFLAKQQRDFDIIVEQAEDEIAAINAVYGSWYVGARGLATTSGGGFALMEEGVSLAGVTEMPLVIHLAQRPGPATGLPTRTEQADLNLALYSGHGEFPRIIYTPGNLEQAFELTQKAFNMADKYQVPVFILTDQYLLNSYYNLKPFDLAKVKIETYITKTKQDYKRYKLTNSGISPRGIPGFGEGLVAVDSHEHDEEGHISEDLDYMRIEQMKKRFRKLELIKEDSIELELIGNRNYKMLILAWGSNYSLVIEAIEKLDNNEIAFLHFKQIYPFPENVNDYLNKAQKIVMIENNFQGQLGQLIQGETCITIDKHIRKYNGMSFSVEELVTEISKAIGEKST